MVESVRQDDGTGADQAGPGVQRYPIRRRPKYSAFMAVGALLGVLAGGLFTFSRPETAEYSYASVIGYTCLLLGLLGVLAGGLLAALLDRRQ